MLRFRISFNPPQKEEEEEETMIILLKRTWIPGKNLYWKNISSKGRNPFKNESWIFEYYISAQENHILLGWK